MIYHLVVAIREAIRGTLQESTLRRQTDEQLERVQAGHEAILASLEQASVEGAERAMAAHFDEAVLSLIYSTGGDVTGSDAVGAE